MNANASFLIGIAHFLAALRRVSSSYCAANACVLRCLGLQGAEAPTRLLMTATRFKSVIQTKEEKGMEIESRENIENIENLVAPRRVQ